MSQKITDRLTVREMFGHVGSLPIPHTRFRSFALLRLVIVIPLAVLPTQIFLRRQIDHGWNPEFGGQLVDIHLTALSVYFLLNLLLVWQARPSETTSFATLTRLNRVAIACEILTSQAYLVAFGSVDNYSVVFLVLIVVPYRVLFDYRTALGTLLVTMGLFVLFALFELGGVLPASPLFPAISSHPIRTNPEMWLNILLYIPVVMILTFMAVNYAVNQSARLHIYVTRSVLQRYLHPTLVDRAAEGELQLDAPPERRVITVMFTDIVGFTALSEKLGPEALGRLLDTLLGDVATLAMEHGATVDKFIGDCVMVVFGAPEPCEPAEQAHRCIVLGHAIHAKVAELGAEYKLKARSGVNTGEAVVGNFGSAARSDYTVLGSTVNLAARLESASHTDRILVGPETARLLANDVPLDAAGTLLLKGISQPVEGWFVASEPAQSRGDPDSWPAQ